MAQIMGGDLNPETVADVAVSTAFGAVWLVHVTLLLALPFARGPGASAGLSGLVVASLALTGHAALQDGALGVAHRANHALHLLATAGWLGGLPPFVLRLAAGALADLALGVAAMANVSLFATTDSS